MFRCAGHLDVSGIEYVCAEPDSTRSVASATIPAAEYEAQVYLLDWDDVPEHPDFIVLLGPPLARTFSGSVATFDTP